MTHSSIELQPLRQPAENTPLLSRAHPVNHHSSLLKDCTRGCYLAASCALVVLLGTVLKRQGDECITIIHTGNFPLSITKHAEDSYKAIWQNSGFKTSLTDSWKESMLCDLPLERFRELAQRQTGEEKRVAQYYYGRRLGCNSHYEKYTNRLLTLTDEFKQEFLKTLKIEHAQHLQGLSLMHQLGGLKVVIPKEGQSFVGLLMNYLRCVKSNLECYRIENCYYFTSGVLLCPDQASFEKLKSQFDTASG